MTDPIEKLSAAWAEAFNADPQRSAAFVAEKTPMLAALAKPDAAPRSLSEVLDVALETERKRREGEEKPIATPWPDLNDSILGGGFWPGLHVIVAGTAAGKTTLAMQLGMHAAHSGHPFVYISLELDEAQAGLRCIALADPAQSLEWSLLYAGTAHAGDAKRAKEIANDLRKLPIGIIGSDSRTFAASDVAATIKSIRATHKDATASPIVVVDYLQLIGNPPGARLEIRERISYASQTLRDVARSEGAVVIALSSTARTSYGALGASIRDAGIAMDAVASGPDRGRSTGDASARTIANSDQLIGLGKESGDIEYSADSLMVIAKVPDGTGGFMKEGRIVAIAKQRAGTPTWIGLNFNGHRFKPVTDGGAMIAAALATESRQSEALPPRVSATDEAKKLFTPKPRQKGRTA